MNTVRNFNIKEDWRFINWKATLITNLYRGIAAGIVYMISII
jgi:hypothetical protein